MPWGGIELVLVKSRVIAYLLKHLVVWLGCVHMICGPQGALQAVAWLSMLVTYSVETGLPRAVVDTFSGAKPCPMCRVIEKTDFGGERHDDPLRPDSRSGTPSPSHDWQTAGIARLDAPEGLPLDCGRVIRADGPPHENRRHRPPTPPPRAA